MYWVISIVEHMGNFVTTIFVGAPSIAEGMSNPYLIPAIQTLLDIVFLILLLHQGFVTYSSMFMNRRPSEQL